MAEYKHKNDGKLHTRYSELNRCTPGGVERVALEILGKALRFQGTGAAGFGTDRHEMWEEEANETGLTPQCFLDELGFQVPATFNEQEFKAKVADGVILHSRPDVVSVPAKMIIDYKTTTGDSSQFYKSKQLLVYAYQLALCGIKIDKMVWLVEIWNKEHTQIIGYDLVEREVKLAELADVKRWIDDRVFILQIALNQLR